MDTTRGRSAGLLSALVVAVVAVTAIAAPAQGHSQLVSSTPAEGESVENPATVSLVFNEALIEVGSDVSVTDAAGVTTALVPTYPEPATLAADLPALAPGAAAVTWRVVSADGHPIEGVLTFDVIAPPEPEPSPSVSPSASESTSPAPSPAPSASVVPISAPEPSGGLPVWLWIALIVAVLAAAGAAVVTSRRR